MGKLDGKVAIITGGASGIGKAAVELFVQQGARVMIADIQDDLGAEMARELGPNAHYLRVDVTREEDVEAVVSKCLERFGQLDCFYNNAGVAGGGGAIEQIPLDEFDRLVAVSLRGVFLGMKHSAPVLKERGGGTIISTASVAGLRAGFSSHVYSAAKAAVIHLTRSVAMELGESGVRVNCICPGAVPTPLFGTAMGMPGDDARNSVERIRPMFADLQPLRRACGPADIAQAALWLASDDSSFVNGHALVVDGGMTAGNTWSSLMETEARLWAALEAAT